MEQNKMDNPIQNNLNKPDIVNTMAPSQSDPSHDILFGSPDGSPVASNGNQPAVGQDPIAVSQQRPEPNPQQQPAPQQLGVNQQQQQNQPEPQTKPGQPLTVEQLQNNYKGLQSKYDSQTAELSSYKAQAEPALQFIEAFDKDEAVRLALFAQYHPDLVKTQNPREVAQKQVQEEFGENFDYETANYNDKILYSERLKEVYNQHRNKPQQFETIEQLRTKRKKESDKRAGEYGQQKSGIMQKHGWNDVQFGHYIDWAQKASLDQLSDIYVGMMNNVANAQQTIPGVVSIPGAPQTLNTQEAEMNTLFGTREPNFLES